MVRRAARRVAAARWRRSWNRLPSPAAACRLRAVHGGRAGAGDGGNARHASSRQARRTDSAALRRWDPAVEHDPLVCVEPASTALAIPHSGLVPARRLRHLRGGNLGLLLSAPWMATPYL